MNVFDKVHYLVTNTENNFFKKKGGTLSSKLPCLKDYGFTKMQKKRSKYTLSFSGEKNKKKRPLLRFCPPFFCKSGFFLCVFVC